MEAYPFGLHNRLRLTEQDRIISLRAVIILFTAFHPDVALLPVTGQALIAVFSSLLAILMRRGLAFSATGMANRSTPSW